MSSRANHNRRIFRIFAKVMRCIDFDRGFAGAVAGTINEHSLLHDGDRVVVAISGGADSVALLAVLTELGYHCIAAHCNFHLRGEESQRDMHHTEQICHSLGVRLLVRDFDVPAQMSVSGESVEMACRTLRYDWFKLLLAEEKAQAVAIGHHREDNIETFLLNVLRGTGIDGLRGMRYRRDNIIRPLLDRSRAEIETYLAKRGLRFITDSSNSSDRHLRNRLRNNVIPEMIRNFPNAENAILRTISNMSDCGAIYDEAIRRYRRGCETSPMTFDLGRLISDDPYNSATILFEMLKELGITASQCCDIISSHDRSGLFFEGPDGIRIELDRGTLRVLRENDGSTGSEISLAIDPRNDIAKPVSIKVSIHDMAEFNPQRDPSILYLDASAIDGDHRWELRHWRQGDRMDPFGMRGSKLISDLFADAKYPAVQKRAAWLLTRDGVILWVIGLRSSSHFTVTSKTKRFVRMEYNH